MSVFALSCKKYGSEELAHKTLSVSIKFEKGHYLRNFFVFLQKRMCNRSEKSSYS